MTHLGPPPDPQNPRRGVVLGSGAARPRNVLFWGSASNVWREGGRSPKMFKWEMFWGLLGG